MTDSMNQFVYPVRVHIEDTDFSGVVYHANYLNYMERARSEWADMVGMGIDWQRGHHIFLVVHSAELVFKSPARLHENLRVLTKVVQLGKASLTYEQKLHLDGAEQKSLCEAKIKVACVDQNMRPCALPDSVFLDQIRRGLT